MRISDWSSDVCSSDLTTTRAGAARRRPAGARAEDSSRAVLTALRRIIRATDLHSKQLSREVGLTTPQVVVLQAVRDLGEVTTGQLSRRVSLSQGTVTTILRSEEHTSELQSLMRISYAVFCLKKKTK